MKQWQRVEKEMPPLRTQFAKRELSYRIRIISLVVILVSLSRYIFILNANNYYNIFYSYSTVEHLLNIITAIQKANQCKHTSDPIENVMLLQMPHIFQYTKYTPAKAIVAKTINIISTFMWTYTDLFVMLISVGLVSRFRQMNASLREHKGMV